MIYPRERFGVEDLALYIVSHFESVIDISQFTDGEPTARHLLLPSCCHWRLLLRLWICELQVYASVAFGSAPICSLVPTGGVPPHTQQALTVDEVSRGFSAVVVAILRFQSMARTSKSAIATFGFQALFSNLTVSTRATSARIELRKNCMTALSTRTACSLLPAGV